MNHVVIEKQGYDIEIGDIVYITGQNINDFVKIEDIIENEGVENASEFHKQTISFNCKKINNENKKIYFYKTEKYQVVVRIPDFNEIRYI